MKLCPNCKETMFLGWIESPLYRDNGNNDNEEIKLEADVYYCAKCNNLHISKNKIVAVDVEDDTYKLFDKINNERGGL